MSKIIHFYAEYSDGEMSECGRGFFADVSFEHGTSNINDVTCKQCLSLFKKREPKRIKDLNEHIEREKIKLN